MHGAGMQANLTSASIDERWEDMLNHTHTHTARLGALSLPLLPLHYNTNHFKVLLRG